MCLCLRACGGPTQRRRGSRRLDARRRCCRTRAGLRSSLVFLALRDTYRISALPPPHLSPLSFYPPPARCATAMPSHSWRDRGRSAPLASSAPPSCSLPSSTPTAFPPDPPPPLPFPRPFFLLRPSVLLLLGRRAACRKLVMSSSSCGSCSSSSISRSSIKNISLYYEYL